MVPGHPFNQLKPNSGVANGTRKKEKVAENRGLRRLFVEQMRKPRANIARLVEMTSHALCAAADGKGKAVQVRHDRKDRLVGNIVADKERTAPLEWFVLHQFQYARGLVETGVLDLAYRFSRQHLDRRVRQIGADQRDRLVDRFLR